MGWRNVVLTEVAWKLSHVFLLHDLKGGLALAALQVLGCVTIREVRLCGKPLKAQLLNCDVGL